MQLNCSCVGYSVMHQEIQPGLLMRFLLIVITLQQQQRLKKKTGQTPFIDHRFPSFNIFITRTFHNFWECSSGNVETGNTDCVQGSTSSHLLMNGTEREARTRIFNISSSALSHSNSDTVYSCRGACTNMAMYVTLYTHIYNPPVECPSEMVSLLDWQMSYVGTQLNFPCSINSGIVYM